MADYRYELLGHLLSGNLFVEPYLVTLLPEARPYAVFQHPGAEVPVIPFRINDLPLWCKAVEVRAVHTLLFDATALHGIGAIHSGLVSHLSVVFTLRESHQWIDCSRIRWPQHPFLSPVPLFGMTNNENIPDLYPYCDLRSTRQGNELGGRFGIEDQ